MLSVFIGYDVLERIAFDVASQSLLRHATLPVAIQRVTHRDLMLSGMYTRPTVYRNDKLWDLISQAPMSTDHAIARFFVPLLCKKLKISEKFALFCDGDVLFRRDVFELIKHVDESKALSVVQHEYQPMQKTKKNDDIQTQYARKNWSSVMLWNLQHPAHERLTLEMLNTFTGRALHRFCWLLDSEIGALDPEWNWLVNHSDRSIDPAIVHFTEGLPNTFGHEDDAYADEWRDYANAHQQLKWMRRENSAEFVL